MTKGVLNITLRCQIAFTVFCGLLPDTAGWASVKHRCVPLAVIGEFNRPTAQTSFHFGREIQRGVELAIPFANKATCLKVEFIDYGNSVANLASVIQREFERKGTLLYLGLGTSDQVMAAVPAIRKINGLLVSPTASSDEIAKPGNRVIQLFPRNSMMAQKLAATAFERSPAGVDVIFASNSSYSKDMKAQFEKALAGKGGRVETSIPIRMGDFPLDPVLAALRASSAKAVFLPLFELDVARVLNALRSAGITKQIIGADSWGTLLTVITSMTKVTAFEAWLPNIYSPEFSEKVNRLFTSSYRKVYKSQPTDLAAFSFEGLLLYADLLNVCNLALLQSSPNECLASAVPFSGVTGVVKGVQGLSLQREIRMRHVQYSGKR